MQPPAGKPAELVRALGGFEGEQKLAHLVGHRRRTEACTPCRPSPEAPPWHSRLRGAAEALCGETGQVACQPFMLSVCTVVPYKSSTEFMPRSTRRWPGAADETRPRRSAPTSEW